VLKEENNLKKCRERWEIEDLGISRDFLCWDGQCLSQSLSVFSHVSKEKTVFSLAFFFVPSFFSTMFRYSC